MTKLILIPLLVSTSLLFNACSYKRVVYDCPKLSKSEVIPLGEIEYEISFVKD